MPKYIQKLQDSIEPLRIQIINHPVYTVIHELEDLRIFMEHHIFAVWDFMSLLKALQINLTCTTLPWVPVGDALTRKLINEIVAGEESDVDQFGESKSHFELYLEAMQQCGANVLPMQNFLVAIQNGSTFSEAYQLANVPKAAQDFVQSTFQTINSQQVHLQSASFTFGREDLIPRMFISIVNDINSSQPDQISIFKYYLDRHIEVDGGEHSHLALSMIEKLCGDNEKLWLQASAQAKIALQARINLWDEAYAEIIKRKIVV